MAEITQPQDTILIVDDNPTNLAVLFDSLEATGFRIFVSTSGEMALNIVEKIRPDLILLDVMMPGLDGFETCRRLKELPNTQETPVIFMTALTNTTDELTGFEVGGVDYITKPLRVETVLARINTHLTLRRLNEQLQKQNERLADEIRLRREAEKQMQAINKKLQHLANLDGLTQIPNRRRFDLYLSQIWANLSLSHQPVTLLLADVDYFKQYNDLYGHLAGDECLQALADLLSQIVAETPLALVARYGGEEFAIVIPKKALPFGIQLAKRIQQEIAMLNIAHEESIVSSQVTISFGIATIVPSSNISISNFISLADQALYQAKTDGRNRYAIA